VSKVLNLYLLVKQALTTLESMIEREWLSSTYETIEEITSASAGVGSFGSQGPVPFWVPPTTAAVALRIRLLDNAIAYSQEAKEEREKQEIEDEINQKNVHLYSQTLWRAMNSIFLRSCQFSLRSLCTTQQLFLRAIQFPCLIN
jgi:hypothetical protein